MARWHGYFKVERKAATDLRWSRLIAELKTLQGTNENGSTRLHWSFNAADGSEIENEDQATVYTFEADFDQADVVFSAFGQRLRRLAGVANNKISYNQSFVAYDQKASAQVQVKIDGSAQVEFTFYGMPDEGEYPTLEESRREVLAEQLQRNVNDE